MSTADLKRDIIRILVGGAIAFVVVGFGAWHLFKWSHRDCKPTVRERVLSPDSLTEAVGWGYDCGWASRGMSAVGVGYPGDPVDSLYHVMSIMDSSAVRLLTNRVRAPVVTLRWTGADTLLVSYPARAKSLTQNTSTYGITIAFDTVRN